MNERIKELEKQSVFYNEDDRLQDAAGDVVDAYGIVNRIY